MRGRTLLPPHTCSTTSTSCSLIAWNTSICSIFDAQPSSMASSKLKKFFMIGLDRVVNWTSMTHIIRINFRWNKWKMSTFQFMHFVRQNWIYFRATFTLSLLSNNHCVTNVKCGFATWDNLSCTEIDKVLGHKINFQGIETLQTLNTLSDYECTKLWRTRNKLTLNMHTCEWKIQALINVALEFWGKNTWIFNLITKLNKCTTLGQWTVPSNSTCTAIFDSRHSPIQNFHSSIGLNNLDSN